MKNLALALLAGGYPQAAVQKHLIKNAKTGNYLFEDIIDAVPADSVFIMTSRVYLSFWQQWWIQVTNKQTGKYKDRNIGVFLDKMNSKGQTNNLAYEMTSRIPSLTMNTEIDEVVIADIGGYYDSLKFVPELIKEKNAVVVQKGKSGSSVDFDWRGPVKAVSNVVPTEKDYWGFTGIVKTTTRDLLVQGTVAAGNMADAVQRMVVGAHGSPGTVFTPFKIEGWMDVESKEAFDSARSLGFITI